MCFGNENLSSFYKLNTDLMYYIKLNLQDIENMLPWEREIYVGLIMKIIQKENEAAAQNA